MDDGTESLGDVPSLSEEVTGTDEAPPKPAPMAQTGPFLYNIIYLPTFAYFNVPVGAAVEFKSSDLSLEAVLSEEGHQVGT